jgi:hypothetical protein
MSFKIWATWCHNGSTVLLLLEHDLGGTMMLCVSTHGPELILSLAGNLLLQCSSLETIKHFSSPRKEFACLQIETPTLDWSLCSFVNIMDRLAVRERSWRSTLQPHHASSYQFEDAEATNLELTDSMCSIVLSHPEQGAHNSLWQAMHPHFVFTFAVPTHVASHLPFYL